MSIDVREYVDWLFSQPLLSKMPKIDGKQASRVAHSLSRLSSFMDSPDTVNRLAKQLAMLPLRARDSWGEPLSPSQCESYLDEVQAYLDRELCQDVTEQLRHLPVELAEADRESDELRADYVEYRNEAGSAAYFLKGGKRRWPNEDLSIRIAVAHEALQEARCPHTLRFLAKKLKEVTGEVQWKEQHVQARVKTGRRQCKTDWPSPYRMEYWLLRDPANKGKGVPESQPFEFFWETEEG